MTTIATQPSVQWRSRGPRGVIAYLVRVPGEFQPVAGKRALHDVALRLVCTECKHVLLLGHAGIYRYNMVLCALSIELRLEAICEHDEKRFFEFTKKEDFDAV